jgi:hypothetical protein
MGRELVKYLFQNNLMLFLLLYTNHNLLKNRPAVDISNFILH